MTRRWELVPHEGIRTGDVLVRLGARRKDVRAALAGLFPTRESHRRGEDQYDADGTVLFLRYTEKSLTTIMFVDGSLEHEGLQLHDTTFGELAPVLAGRGYTVRPDPVHFVDGVDVPELGVNVATVEDVGGDGDEIEWVALWQATGGR